MWSELGSAKFSQKTGHQSIMDKRRQKNKSKFTGMDTFIIHPSSASKKCYDYEWIIIVEIEDGCRKEKGVHDEEQSFGYLDPETGNIVTVVED